MKQEDENPQEDQDEIRTLLMRQMFRPYRRPRRGWGERLMDWLLP